MACDWFRRGRARKAAKDAEAAPSPVPVSGSGRVIRVTDESDGDHDGEVRPTRPHDVRDVNGTMMDGPDY